MTQRNLQRSTPMSTNDAALRSGGTRAARLGPSDSGNILSAAQNLTIADAEFNNVHGHRTNLVINLNQNSPAESPSRTGITSDYPSMASSRRNTRTNTHRAEPSRAPQTFTESGQSNIIYQRHLELKGHGFPLWIPPANQNLPVQYRRTGVRIGDVGIITPTGAFSFLFNICLPRDDPVNLRSLPEHFSPVSPGPFPFIDKFPVFGHGSHLASTSIEKTQANSQSLGFQFESSASEGAILTMPLGATSERLENISSFRRYAASNLVHWYKLVNVGLGREAKNGDIRLVTGCVKTKSWGIATFANQSRQSSCRLRFGPLSDPSSSDSSRYFWEYSGTADVRAGPSPGENDGLRLVDDSGDVYENQCLFLRTLNPTLPDNVWSEIHHDPGSGDLSLQGDSRPAKDSASRTTSTRRTSATKPRSSTLPSHRFVSGRNRGLQNNTVPFDKLAMFDTDPLSSFTSHPSNALNRILMEMVPTARMVITQDDDWSSIASKYDTIPDPHELIEQILVSHRICEEDGVIFLDRQETMEGVSSAQVLASEGLAANVLDTNTLPQPSLNLSSTSISTVIPSVFDRSSPRSSLDYANTLESFSLTSIYESKTNLVDNIYSIEISGIVIKSPTIIAFIKLSIGSTFQRDFDFAAEKLKEVTLTLTPARLSLPFSTILILKVHQKGLLHRSKKLDIRYQDLLSNASIVDADANRREYRRTVNGIEVCIKFITSQETLLVNANQLSTADKISEVNTGDHEKLQNAGDQDETPIHEPEREQKKAATPLQPTLVPVTVPCQYSTGKTLSSDAFSILKDAIHIETGKHFACKVINKRFEHMARNEIAVLKRISSGHRNIVTLHDFFETSHNVYLCFDLCSGGELFDRLCAKGNYYEADAAFLVNTIFKALKYIHDSGIVHRNMIPENLLFKTPQEDADIMLTGFGLSRIIEDHKLDLLTEVCGTPGYMAPEIFQKSGYGKPVDVWAMGVLTYFLLAGYTPFDRDTQQEMEAVIAGDYKFEPEEYWHKVSPTAKDFVRTCLTIDPAKRPTAELALQHKWLVYGRRHFVPDPAGVLAHLVNRNFNAKQMWRKVALTIDAVNRMATLAHVEHYPVGRARMRSMREDIYKYKEDILEHAGIAYQRDALNKLEDISVDSNTDLLSIMAEAVKRDFNAKQLWRKAAFTIMAINRMAALAHVERVFSFNQESTVAGSDDEDDDEVWKEKTAVRRSGIGARAGREGKVGLRSRGPQERLG